MERIVPLEEMIKTPLVFLQADKETIQAANELLPYSTGMEINACYKEQLYNYANFQAIPDIILDCTSSSSEQRYRIPNGVVGMICLWNLSKQLKLNCDLNPDAGIHYHVDCKTDGTYNYLVDQRILAINADWVLSELDTWQYPGNYHSRALGSYFRYNDYQTVEFRVGEMTFDYNLLLKRILHVNDIMKMLKSHIRYEGKTPTPITYKEIDVKLQLKYQKNYLYNCNRMQRIQQMLDEEARKLAELNKPKEIEEEIIILRNRTHKI